MLWLVECILQRAPRQGFVDGCMQVRFPGLRCCVGASQLYYCCEPEHAQRQQMFCKGANPARLVVSRAMVWL
jgi:hypothetical protein